MRWMFLLSALSACATSGGPAFAPTFPDNVDESVQTVLARLRSAPAPPAARTVAAGVSNDELVVVDLAARRRLWKQPVVSPVSAPQVAGDLVFLHEQSGVVARDLHSGRVRFTIPDEALYLAGADGEGDSAIVSLTTGGGVGARSKLVLARGGRIQWTKSIDYAAGAPTLTAGMIFIPWATQNLSVLEASSGEEIARVRITDTTVGRAFRHRNDIYFGQRGLFRLTPSVTSGRRDSAAYFEPRLRQLPGDPQFMVDPYQPTPSPASALHRVRYAWHAAGEGEEVRLADDNLYAIFYRIVFAFDPVGEGVRWVYVHDRDIIGALGQEGGLLLADAEGGFAYVGADDGLRRWSHEFDETPLATTIRADAFAPTDAPEGEARPLHDQLLAAAQTADARLVPARAIAAHLLGALPEAEATRNLITLCDDRRAPPPLKAQACAALAERTTGVEFVIEALQRHARFLAETTAPPVTALARAAVRAQAPQAVPLLLDHLRDPATEASNLAPLIEAVGALGDRAAVEPLADFLRLYHAEASDDATIAAVVAAARALVALQGSAAQDTIRPAADDPLAPEAVRAQLGEILAALAAEQAEQAEQADTTDSAENTDNPDRSEGPEADAAEPRPERIDASVVERALRPVHEQLRACVREDSEGARSARIVLRIAGDGSLQSISVAPARLRSCLEPFVRRAQFPANRRNVTEQVTYRVRR